MRITIDRSICQDHGQCAIAAPAVFRMNDEGIAEYDETPDESLRADVEAAADACPALAVLIED